MGDFIDRWLNRDLHRILHPPRLHPKMRERMWKPGQSGNSTGMNSIVQAARERREAAEWRRLNPSPGSARMRRMRRRKQHGVVVVNVEAAPDMTAELIRLGWLSAAMAGDKTAIVAALLRLAETAIEMDMRPIAGEK
jgi:hypothetical protein